MSAVARYVLRLYVAGSSSRSLDAVANITRVCERHLRGNYDLEVIDIYQAPEAAAEGQVIAAPTLVKSLPEPLRRIIGDLANEDRLLVALGMRVAPEGAA
ncbi:MAG TPA: circadian clock KaiB family protein [Gemmatimonadaceae bacterium]|nr:circadian clock KaiB family protein [Gemmatimonadaceae bacterium]